MNRKLALMGMLAPIIYVFHVVLGGFLWIGYSHLSQPISGPVRKRYGSKVIRILHGIGLEAKGSSPFLFVKGN